MVIKGVGKDDQMVHCSNCGKNVKEGYKHCPSCGYAIDTKDKEKYKHAKEVRDFAAQDVKDQIMWKNAPPKTKGFMKIILIILVILLIASFAVVLL